jgi:hypothetical protein
MAAWATTEAIWAAAEAGTAADGTAGTGTAGIAHGGAYGGGYGAIGALTAPGGAIAAGSQCPYGYYLASDYACYPY